MSESWKGKHVLKIRDDREQRLISSPDAVKLRQEVEPWLTALFQSEHLSLLTGAGISSGVHIIAAGKPGAGMGKITFPVFNQQVQLGAEKAAKDSGRGEPNIEDQIRVANELLIGLEVFTSTKSKDMETITKEIEIFSEQMSKILEGLVSSIVAAERGIVNSKNAESALEYLMNFLISFSSRATTRERLNIFTTNYDRVIEFGAELAGIRLMDRFVGSISPIFRSSRLEVDLHYNPPGIRGEPRYLEGVAHFTKLHGSLDWIYQNGNVRRVALPFGADTFEIYLPKIGKAIDTRSLMIYPNAAKDKETAEYPYVELFRDLAAAVCRPNSTLVVYGYSFGDDHINRIIRDMLTIPSTHLVIIAWSDEGDRIQRFYEKMHRPAQTSLLIGEHFGDLKTLVDSYLPKPAIDRTTIRMAELLRSRGYESKEGGTV